MLKELGYQNITVLINKLIQSDPLALDYLKPLHQKSMRLVIQKTPFDLMIIFNENAIEVLPFNGTENATIALKGAPSALIRFAKTHEHTRLLMEKDITIEGELAVLLDIKRFQEELSIDWEELLANYLGDFAANRLVTLGRSVAQHLKYKLARTQDHVADYIKHESDLLVTKPEITKFQQQVLTLRRDVERLEARINRLTRNSHV